MKKITLLAVASAAFFYCFVGISQSQIKTEKAIVQPGDKKPRMITLKPGEPEELIYDAGKVRFLAEGKDTHNAWSLVEVTEMPGYRTRIHRHIYTDEAYYVLEGTLTAMIGDKTYELPAGSYIVIPHGTPHAQGNLGKSPVRVLLTMTPSGFEESFRDRAEIFKTADPKDPGLIQKRREEMMTKKKYDREFLGDWNPKE